MSNWQLEIEDNHPVIFIDTAGCGFNEETNPETLSRLNKGEFFILREHFLHKRCSFFPPAGVRATQQSTNKNETEAE